MSTGSWRVGIAAADVVGSTKLGANGAVMAVETQKQTVMSQELMVIDLAMTMLP